MSPFFHRDNTPEAWQAGVKTTGTIERVFVTGWGHGNPGEAREAHQVFLAISYADQGGAPAIVEREYYVPSVPLPGSTAPIAYLPGSPDDSLDFIWSAVADPDPSVPRGWSAGMFEIPPLGERCITPPDPGLDAERELFRTGRRLEAKVVDRHMKLLQLSPHGENQHYTLRLLADGTQYETQVWAHGECVPSEGHMIQIAVSPDGSQVALDTDERYYGPPGRALVWTVPFEMTAPGVTQAATTQLNERLQAQLVKLDAMNAAGELPDAPYQQARANVLGAMGGQLETAKARLLGS